MREYDLYVPLHFNDGRRVPSLNLRHLKNRLIQRFGGLTQFPQKHDGFWKIGTATFRDQIIILRVLSSQSPSRSRRFWNEVKATLQTQWKQKEVLIVVKDVTRV